MSNSSYQIQGGNLDSFAGSSSNSNFKLNETGGETATGQSSGTNYTLKAGFQYIPPNISSLFSFSMSTNTIDFGILSPTDPITRTQILTIQSPAGYSVNASENTALTSAKNFIPDTTCDTGTCSEKQASTWINTLSYGFGYRCDNLTGSDCASGFTDVTAYKQFANTALTKIAQPVMLALTGGAKKQTTITYKVNIAATQPSGTYGNTITYVASPTF